MLFPDVVVDTVEEFVPALPGASQLVPVKVSHVGTLEGARRMVSVCKIT